MAVNNFLGAKKSFELAVSIRRNQNPANQALLIKALLGEAQALGNLKDFRAAEESYLDVVSKARQLHGDGSVGRSARKYISSKKARRDRQQRRRHLTKKADAYEAYRRLERFLTILQSQMTDEPNDQANRIIQSLGRQMEADRQQFTASTLEGEARDLGLFAEDDQEDLL